MTPHERSSIMWGSGWYAACGGACFLAGKPVFTVVFIALAVAFFWFAVTE